MRRVILESPEPVTLVPIAALTNLALLFAMYPEVKGNIREIVMMGGSASRGNKGVMSEFNVATDPEAAQMVFQSGLPISAVAEQVGISDYNYFSKVFRSATGMTPSAFRKNCRDAASNFG